MATHYSGVQVEIERVLKSVKIGTDRLSSITPVDLDWYQSQADAEINDMLSGSYYVPLKQVTVDGVTKFPDPIPIIAAMQTAVLIMQIHYTEVEPNEMNSVTQLKEEIRRRIAKIIDGATVGANVLRGQLLRARTHFVNPRVAPREDPKATST